jgi:hypothetical protein
VKNRLWINLGLLGLIVILIIFVLNDGQETGKELQRLSTIDKNTIKQIQVFRKDLDNFQFDKKDNGWFLTSPQQYRANSARINAMLRMLEVESHAQLNPAEIDLKQLSLEDPIVTMKLNDHEFQFGNTDAIDQRRYVLFQNKIHLTNDSLYQQLMANAAFFADPNLIPDSFKISSIEYPDNILKQVDEQWQLETLMDIKPDQLKRIPFNWENALAISAEPFKQPEAAATIKINSTDNKQIQYVIVSKEPHLVLGRKDLGIQFHMGSDETNKLLLIENTDMSEETETPGLQLHPTLN